LALYYLETSALVKLYIREPGTDRLLALAARSKENRLAILSLAQVELRSAIRRREKKGDIPPRIATQLLGAFQRHIKGRFLIQTLSDFLLDVASVLVDRYVLRAFDAVQLAGYIVLKRSAGTDLPVFVCSDQTLLTAARREGVPILDPAS